VNTTINTVVANVTGVGQPLAVYQTGRDLTVATGDVRTNSGSLTLDAASPWNLTVTGNIAVGSGSRQCRSAIQKCAMALCVAFQRLLNRNLRSHIPVRNSDSEIPPDASQMHSIIWKSLGSFFSAARNELCASLIE
jgi:hypothetical protein